MTDASLEPWRAFLHRFDAAIVPGPRPAWQVAVRGIEVTVELAPDGVHAAPVRVSMALPLRMRALSIVGRERALYTKGRLFTGDAELDDAVVVHAPDNSLYGIFDYGGRELVAGLVAAGVHASGGALVLEPWAASALEGAQIAATLEAMTSLALMLSQPPDELLAGIARIVEGDPNPAVRATYEHGFGGAADVRDARAKLRVEGQGFGTSERLELLASQAKDSALGIAVRREAYERMLIEFRLERVTGRFDEVPSALRAVLVPRVLARMKEHADEVRAQRATHPETDANGTPPVVPRPLAESQADRIAGARILLALARGERFDGPVAREVVAALSPLALPEGLPFLASCAGRGVGGEESLGDLAIAALFVLDVDVDAILAELGHDVVRARVLDRAPQALWHHPRALGPRYLELLGRAHPQARSRYLESLALAHAHWRTSGRPHPERAAHRERALAWLDSEEAEIQAAALSVLAELGEVPDLPRIGTYTSGFFRPGKVKDAARRALDEIRERLNVPEDAGGLSLAEPSGGGLSTPDE